MTQSEQIIAEIKRLYEKNETYPKKNRDLINMGLYRGRKQTLEMLLDFINTLPTEPSEKLKEAAIKEAHKRYRDCPALNIGGDYEFAEYHGEERELFVEGALWGANCQKEKDINRACKWLNENVVEYHPRTGKLRPIVNINAFREAMNSENF